MRVGLWRLQVLDNMSDVLWLGARYCKTDWRTALHLCIVLAITVYLCADGKRGPEKSSAVDTLYVCFSTPSSSSLFSWLQQVFPLDHPFLVTQALATLTPPQYRNTTKYGNHDRHVALPVRRSSCHTIFRSWSHTERRSTVSHYFSRDPQASSRPSR